MVSRLNVILSTSLIVLSSHASMASIDYDIANDHANALSAGVNTLSPEYLNDLAQAQESLIMSDRAGEESQISVNTRRGAEQVSPELINNIIAKQKEAYKSVEVKQGQKPSVIEKSNAISYKILISDSMGKDRLQQLIQSFEHSKNVSFVIRGLLPTETTINDASKRIINLVVDLGLTDMPAVQLDPTPFQDVHATVVPQILMYKGNDLVLSAKGLVNPRYMKVQYEQGKKGDLGVLGDTTGISERDLTEILRERAAKLDGKKLANDAKARYWDNVAFLQLPNATETKQRVFVPLLTVDEDVLAPNGQLIAFKGQQINTLERMAFTQRLVIFDATDKAQLDFVKNLPETNLRTKYISTRFDRKLKWDAVKTIEKQLNSSVFMLNADVINAFNVQRLPSVITADNDRKVFLINEYQMIRKIDNGVTYE